MTAVAMMGVAMAAVDGSGGDGVSGCGVAAAGRGAGPGFEEDVRAAQGGTRRPVEHFSWMTILVLERADNFGRTQEGVLRAMVWVVLLSRASRAQRRQT